MEADASPRVRTRDGLATVLSLVAAAVIFAVMIGSGLFLNARSDAKSRNVSATVAVVAVLSRKLTQLQAAMLDVHQTRPTPEILGLVDSIDQGLPALIEGKTAEGALGQTVKLEPPSSAVSLDQLHSALAQWQPASDAIRHYHDALGRNGATAVLNDTEPTLATTFENVGAETTRISEAQISADQTTRNAITAGAIVLLALILVILIRRINTSRDRVAEYAAAMETRNNELIAAANALAESKSGTDVIMDTVSQGLFLMNAELKIEGQYSRELEDIFRVNELRGSNVLNLLQRILTERMYNTTRDYFALLFNTSKKERVVLKVNPLQQVEVNFANASGGYTSRYLSFAFRRIMSDGAVSRIFVAVNDITKNVELEQQLRSAELAKDRQFDFLLGVLHLAPAELDEFVSSTREQLSVMNAALRVQDFAGATTGQMANFRGRLDTVFKAVHSVKGHAQAVKFSHFVDLCHQLESQLVMLRNRSALSGDDFLSVVIAQAELAKDIDELMEVRGRFGAVSAIASPAIDRSKPNLVTTLERLVDSTAETQQKRVRFEAIGLDVSVLDDTARRLVTDTLIQFARNSVTHGIELPEERIRAGKVPIASVTLTVQIDPATGTFAFTFRDDGRGLDPAAIKAHAVERGIISAAEAQALTPPQAIGLIFRPGFSTAGESTTDGGRGFGMNIVKENIVDRLGGKINLRSEPQRFTEFVVAFPLKTAPALAGASA